MPGKKFPDLTGDGKVTRKDILKGRGVEGFKKGGEVEPHKRPRTKAQKEAVQSEMDELRAKGAMSFPRPDSVSVEERARAKNLVRQENRRSRSERKTQQEMGSFKEGGKVKVERINKKGRTEAVEKALKALGAMKQGDIQAKYPTKGKRDEKRPEFRDPGADDRMKEFERSAREAGFADGGMVRGCKGVQVSGKGFKGTF